MKKVILLVALLTIFSIVSAEHSFGVKGGLNMADLSGRGNGNKYKLGAIGGLFYDIPINEHFSIQPEVLFTMKGSKYELNREVADEDGNSLWNENYLYTQTFNYLEIPVIAKMTIHQSDSFITKIYFGPFMGFNLSAKYHLQYLEYDHKGDEDVILVEMGVTPGVMLEFSNRMIIDLRYTTGLTDVFDFGSNNRVISFMLGYKI